MGGDVSSCFIICGAYMVREGGKGSYLYQDRLGCKEQLHSLTD